MRWSPCRGSCSLLGLGLRGVEAELEESAWLERPGWRVVVVGHAPAFDRHDRRCRAGGRGAHGGGHDCHGPDPAADVRRGGLHALAARARAGLGRRPRDAATIILLVILLLVAIRALARMDPVRVIRLRPAGADRGRWEAGGCRSAWRAGASSAVCWVCRFTASSGGQGRVGPGLRPGLGRVVVGGGSRGGHSRRRGWIWSIRRRQLDRTLLVGTLLWAALGATLAVVLAWSLAWKSLRPGPWRWLTAAVVALLLAVPGPIAGLALKLAYSGGGLAGTARRRRSPWSPGSSTGHPP